MRGPGGCFWEFLVGVCCLVIQPDPLFQTKKNVIFHTRFQTWPSLLRLERILKKYFKSISNSHISLSFLLIWN